MAKRTRMKYSIVAVIYITCVPILATKYIEFNEEPTDLVVMRNKPAKLRCNVTARNNVNISWMKDGKALDLSNDTRRTILSDGSLYFQTIVRQKKLSPDAGVYRCVGETKVNGIHFKIISQKARLTVVGMSKSFAVTPQDLTVSEGETALFECAIKRSRPEAKITWSKEGKNTDLTLNFRFVVFPSGTLEILSVMKSDAGNYICKATNEELGKSITAKATLIITHASTVSKAKKFLVKPRDVMILHDGNAILECIVTGYPKPQVEWYKDGVKITLTQSGHYSKYGVSSLKVSSAKVSDSGKYECVMESERAEAQLKVVVPPQLKYLPKDIETFERIDIKIPCEVTGNPQPKITWHKNGDVIDEVKFEHIKVGDDGITIMEALESDEGIYQCFAKNDGGEVKASAQLTIKRPPTTAASTTKATTIASTTSRTFLAPSAPKNVRAAAESTTAIRVFWEEPDQPHGKIKNYTVVTHRSPDFDFQSMLTTQDTHLVVTNLQPGTSYQFSVYAFNGYKSGALSTSVTESTMKSKTPTLGPPRDVKATAVSSIALTVSWKPPSNALQVIRNYSIEYRDIDQNSPWRIESSVKHDIVLLKLHPYTEYSVKVTAHTDRGPGQTSSVVVARTKSGKPKGPPENVRFVASNGILLATWDPPSDPNGNISGYSLQLKNEDSGNVSNLTSKKTSYIFMSVEKSATYAFRAAAITEAGEGEFSPWVKTNTPPPPLTEDLVPGQPTNMRIRVVLGMVQVSWDPPKESHIIVRNYVLSYGKMTPGDNFKTLPNTTTTYLVKNLQSETIYIIRVRAKNRKGQGLEALERVTIPRLKQSSGIHNLQALPIKKRTIKLSWVDLTISLRPNVGYHVKFEKNNTWLHFNVTKDTSLTVKDLRPGMIYTFYVKRNDETNFIPVSNRTREEVPSTPKDVTFTFSEEQGTVNVHWNTPDKTNGRLTNYKICWKLKDSYQNYNWSCKMVKAHVLNDKISNINRSLEYVVKILAKNRAGEGKFSKPVRLVSALHMVTRPTKVSEITTKDPSNNSTLSGGLTGNDLKSTELYINVIPTPLNTKKAAASGSENLTFDEKTLWIVIAVIAAITLIAIVIISIVLCKKRSRGTPVIKRKPPPDPYKAVANGNSKKKNNKENYWIKQDQIELEPCVKKDDLVTSTIPRNADEMKALDSPFQSRKDRDILVNDEDEPDDANDYPPRTFADDPPYRHREDYQPLPIIPSKQDNINIQKSPFMPVDPDEFPPPPEYLDDNQDEGPSSDYGSEEMVSPKCAPDEAPPVTYMPKNAPNGCVSVASDYNYPMNKHAHDMEESNLQSLMRDLDAIMAKEDRV